jgi:hypothetical protein
MVYRPATASPAPAGEPADMMLVFAETPDFLTRVFIGLPDPELIAKHPGFQPVAENDPPKRPKLLMGNVDEFKRQFPRSF